MIEREGAESHVSGVLHTVRTSLNQLLGYSEMLLEDGAREGRAASELRDIVTLTRRMLGTLQDALPESSRAANAELVAALRERLQPLARDLILSLSRATVHLPEGAFGDILPLHLAASELLGFVLAKEPSQATPDPAPAMAALEAAGSAKTARRRILVVDDNERNRRLLTRQLDRPDSEVLAVADGPAALAALEEADFDVVLLDLLMPGMNGAEVLKRMKAQARWQHVPVILLSALGQLRQAEQAIAAGAEDYVVKPAELILLRARIGAVLERKRLRDQERRRTAELEQIEQQLRRSNEELERFAHAASHDLQEPLRTVASYAQILSRRYHHQLDADGQEFLAFLVDGAKRMQELIEDLLAYAAVSTGERVPLEVSCEEIVDEALEWLKGMVDETGAKVSRGELPVILADRVHLRQLFVNLIGNALKYRKPTEAPRVSVVAETSNGAWLFTVQDNGIGIPAHQRQNIFAVFRRLHGRDVPGSGIGLAICQRVVERLGGHIWAESTEGEGSAFRFTVPVRASV